MYLNIIESFKEIAFYGAIYVYYKIYKKIRNQKKTKSTHIPLTVWGLLGDCLTMKCVRAPSHPWVGLGSADLASTGREDSSLGFGGFYFTEDPWPPSHPRVSRLWWPKGEIKAFYPLIKYPFCKE